MCIHIANWFSHVLPTFANPVIGALLGGEPSPCEASASPACGQARRVPQRRQNCTSRLKGLPQDQHTWRRRRLEKPPGGVLLCLVDINMGCAICFAAIFVWKMRFKTHGLWGARSRLTSWDMGYPLISSTKHAWSPVAPPHLLRFSIAHLGQQWSW